MRKIGKWSTAAPYQYGGLGRMNGLRVGVGVKRKVRVEVGSGVALGVNNGSRQAGIESRRAAGSRVWPS